MTWTGITIISGLALLWGCWLHRRRARDAEENVRKLLVWWWKQAKPGVPIPNELQRRKP